MITTLAMESNEVKRRLAQINTEGPDVHAMILHFYVAPRSSHLGGDPSGEPSH